MNVLDEQLTQEQKDLACKVLNTLNLDGMKVLFKDRHLHFIQDRRAVYISMDLILKDQWADIRFLFRSILQPGPSVWNHEASDRPFESYLKS